MPPDSRGRRKKLRARRVIEEFEKQRDSISNQEWERLLGRVNKELEHAKLASAAQNPPHVEVEAVLPFYVKDAQRGEDVRALYPFIWRHLQSCEDCRNVHDLLVGPADPAVASNQADLKPNLNLLGDSSPEETKNSPWQLTYSRKKNRTESAVIRFDTSFVIRCLSAVGAPTQTRGARPQETCLLFADLLTLERGDLQVDTWVEPSLEKQGNYRVRVALTQAPGSKLSLQASLRWGGKNFKSKASQDQLVFEITNPPDLHTYSQSASKPSYSDFALTLKVSKPPLRKS